MGVLYIFPVFLASNGERMMVDELRWTTRMDLGGQETPFLFAFILIVPNPSSSGTRGAVQHAALDQ